MEINQVSFAVTEAALFLDTHPCDEAALTYYHQMVQKKKEAIRQYQKNFGPLLQDGNESDCTWDWSTTPWPWE